ncbi:alpha/beta-hydrolase [Clavulina sp. PMI_390]|nr:alpha/beta-hydrolase [Clavulina sp. PMI_390]
MAQLAYLSLLSLIYLIPAVILLFFQRKLIYPAWMIPGEETRFYGGEIILLSSGKFKIRCLVAICPAHRAKGVTVLIFHANAAADMGDFVSHFVAEGCHVVVPTYRGYGSSEGSPSGHGLKQDAQAALDYILGHEMLRSTRIVIFGYSLGGAVASYLASKNPNVAKALIIANAWDTLPHLIWQNIKLGIPFIPFLTTRWESDKAIKKVGPDTSILIMNGQDDQVVPPNSHIRNGRAADSRSTNPGVINRTKVLPGDHASLAIYPDFFYTIRDFAQEINLFTPSTDFISNEHIDRSEANSSASQPEPDSESVPPTSPVVSLRS